MIRPVTIDDAARIAEIYNHYVTDTIITFEEETVDAADYEARIKSLDSKGLPWIVWESDGVVAGYAYAGPWRTRIAYRFTVESAIYIAQDCVGKGIGKQLYGALFDVAAATKLQLGDGFDFIAKPRERQSARTIWVQKDR